MSTAREVLLEVKRRLGDVNIPYPDEADALAFLNKALQGIHGYGIYLHSPRLMKSIIAETDENGEYTVEDGIAYMAAVISNVKDHKSIYPVNHNRLERYAYYEPSQWHYAPEDNYRYFVGGSTISFVPLPKEPIKFSMRYWPQYKPIGRDDEVPFTPDLSNLIERWTLGLVKGDMSSVSDFEYATKLGAGNTLSTYFRGQYHTPITGRGPW